MEKKEEEAFFSFSSSHLNDILSMEPCALTEDDMIKRNILQKYHNKYWYSEHSERWICYVPDRTKKEGRRQVSRKKQSDIEDIVYKVYSKVEEQSEEEKKAELIGQMTFQELFFEFMSHKKTQVKARTISRMMVDWGKYYEPNKDFINKPFKEITKVDVDDFLNDIVEKYHPKNKCFRGLCGIIKQTFEYAVDMEYLDKSPYRNSKVNKKNIIPDRKKDNRKEIFTIEEQTLIIEEMKRRTSQKEFYLVPLVIQLDFEIGARIGEVLALKESDIENDKIHIRRQFVKEEDVTDLKNIKDKGWTIAEYTKTYSGDRLIPLTATAKECIEHIKSINKRTGKQYEDYLFYKPDDVISENAVESLLRRTCVKLNIPSRSPHKIRKTYASRLYSKGVSVSDISKLLGHVDETTTWKHYIFSMDNTEERDRKVREALQENNYNKEENRKSEVPDSITLNQKIIYFPTDKKAHKPRKFNVRSIK